MDPIRVFPDCEINPAGKIGARFLQLNLLTFQAACEYVHRMPYGYNADRDDLMSLFREGQGTCTTKHAVIATLARELGLEIHKRIGIYAMTEALVTGADAILRKYALPYLPMVHCFLASESHRVDLTEGNANGKNGPIDKFLYTVQVEPGILAKDEYLLYRKALKDRILLAGELKGMPVKTVLKAREEGLALLKAKIVPNRGGTTQ